MSSEIPGGTPPDMTQPVTTPLYDEASRNRSDTAATSDATGQAGEAADQAKDVAGDAKDAAQDVASNAKGAVQDVAGSVADHASDVTAEAKAQAKGFLDEAGGALREQAGTQQKRASEELHSVGDQLTSMAESADSGGPAVDLVRSLGSRVGAVADWLGARDTDQALADVRAYAAEKPGAFIGLAAAAGIVAGRLSKSLAANKKDEVSSTAGSGAPASGQVAGDVRPAFTSPDYAADPARGQADSRSFDAVLDVGAAGGADEIGSDRRGGSL